MPTDLSEEYNTPLSPTEEAQFRRWLALLPPRLQSTADYDMRGAWKADAKAAINGHLPDTWKKPNHPTFSSESQYSKGTGGKWSPAGGDNWVYWASPANLKYRSASGLSSYFQQAEPDATLVLPSNYRLPPK